MTVFEARTTGPHQTRALAAALADVLLDGDLMVLSGDLGAGKTCFTQGLGAGLGIEARLTSPTFTLANRHVGRLVLNHLDAYRLDGPGGAGDLDLIGLLEDGVTVIEWGERLDPLLPEDRLVIRLSFEDDDGADDDHRLIRFEGWVERELDRVLSEWAAP